MLCIKFSEEYFLPGIQFIFYCFTYKFNINFEKKIRGQKLHEVEQKKNIFFNKNFFEVANAFQKFVKTSLNEQFKK